jgi:predicted ATPase
MLATSLDIRGFKAFEDCTIPLQPMCVVVGANGVGKTTVLQAMALFGQLTKQSLPSMLESTGWDYSDLPHLRSRDQRFGVTAHFAGESLEWELSLQTRRRPGIHIERVTQDGEPLMWRDGRTMGRLNQAIDEPEEIRQTLTSSWLAAIDPVYDAKAFPALAQLNLWAAGMRTYLLDAWQMRRPSRSSAELGENGQNLAGFLRHLRDHRPEAFRRVIDRVRDKYPRLHEVVLLQKAAGWTELDISETWVQKPIRFNARQVSDGLLRLLAIAAMFELDDTPSVVLLDEIENGLHPHLLRGVVEMLQDLVDESDGQTQVIATTHSPIALNYVRDASQILVGYRDQDSGAAKVSPMVDLPRYEALSAYFDKGDLWYNVGEQGLVQAPRKKGRR